MAGAACLVAKERKVTKLGVKCALADDGTEMKVAGSPVDHLWITLESHLGRFERKTGHTQRTSGDKSTLAERSWRCPGGHRSYWRGVRAVRARHAFPQVPTFFISTSFSLLLNGDGNYSDFINPPIPHGGQQCV